MSKNFIYYESLSAIQHDPFKHQTHDYILTAIHKHWPLSNRQHNSQLPLRVATLPATEFNFETALLSDYPRAVIRAAEYRTDVVKLMELKAIQLSMKFSKADIAVQHALFADMVKNDPQGNHVVWFDSCNPLRSASNGMTTDNPLDPANTVAAIFENKYIFEPAWAQGKPGLFFVTVSRKRNNFNFMRWKARRAGLVCKPVKNVRWSEIIMNRRYNNTSLTGAVIQQVQEVTAKVDLYAVPMMVLMYNRARRPEATTGSGAAMLVVGFDVEKARTSTQRKNLELEIEYCRDREVLLANTICLK